MLSFGPFPIDQLVEASFSEKLRALLDEARRVLQLSAAGVAELAATEGCVRPVWRQCSPWSRPPAPIQLELFDAFVQGPAVRPATRADLAALGAPLDDCGAATLVVLEVTPSLSQHADALLILLHERDAQLDQTALSQLKACLERGLSADRRKRLGEAIVRAVEQAADPIELTDSHARLLYANLAWERTFGYAAREVVGQTVGRLFRDPVAPLHDNAFYQFTLATLADGSAWSGALACRARDGQRVFCEPMVSPFEADEQGFRGNFAVRRNLAQRSERDAALAIAHHEFRAVLAAIPDGVAVLRDGKIYFVNAAFLRMVRRSEASVIGLSYVDLVHPDDRAQFLKVHESSVTRARMLREDNTARFAEISTAGAVSFEGKPAMILLSRDLTEQRVAEEQLARADRLSALGSLAAGVAHEINNPLAYVLLNLRYIQREGLLRGPAREALEEALDGSSRIQQIVTDLRGYSGPDAAGPPEPVSVAKAATSALNIAQTEIRHRARLERRIDDDLHVLAREGQLVQVLVNVLVNAAQAIPAADGRTHLIELTAARESAERAVIEISDTGVGIAPSVITHVFEPFSTTKQRGEGSGLGLAICKRIVEDLGGRISIRSTLGEGSTVRIELLPAAGEPATQDLARAAFEPPRVHGRTIRMLIVDDEITIASSLKRMLPQYDVRVTSSAGEALEMIGAERFDVILCDLMMPGMSGAELYAAACGKHPALGSRFVFMTGGVFNNPAREFLESTPCSILEKPFTVADVCRTVQQLTSQDATREVTQETSLGGET